MYVHHVVYGFLDELKFFYFILLKLGVSKLILYSLYNFQIHPGALKQGGIPLVACCISAAERARVSGNDIILSFSFYFPFFIFNKNAKLFEVKTMLSREYHYYQRCLSCTLEYYCSRQLITTMRKTMNKASRVKNKWKNNYRLRIIFFIHVIWWYYTNKHPRKMYCT